MLNEQYLIECWKELKKGKAGGIDNRTIESYTEEEIKEAIRELVQRMKERRYKPKPARRAYIAKANGKLRPLAVPSVIDKVVQQGMKKMKRIYRDDKICRRLHNRSANKGNSPSDIKRIEREIKEIQTGSLNRENRNKRVRQICGAEQQEQREEKT